MRSNEVFSSMSPEESVAFLAELKEDAPPVARMALLAAANAFKLRPEFLKRQPKERQAEWMRRALGRRMAALAAEEILATYYMDHQNELLVELLDALGLEHEDGALPPDEKPKCPSKAKLKTAVEKFRKGKSAGNRERLLLAFASQSAVEWPALEEILDAGN